MYHTLSYPKAISIFILRENELLVLRNEPDGTVSALVGSQARGRVLVVA